MAPMAAVAASAASLAPSPGTPFESFNPPFRREFESATSSASNAARASRAAARSRHAPTAAHAARYAAQSESSVAAPGRPRSAALACKSAGSSRATMRRARSSPQTKSRGSPRSGFGRSHPRSRAAAERCRHSWRISAHACTAASGCNSAPASVAHSSTRSLCSGPRLNDGASGMPRASTTSRESSSARTTIARTPPSPSLGIQAHAS
mmetsp:Transcript_3648/g.14662  ORF Transcript_3648/g.14662 Transcript_3648/m.14662 type:complete len:208 (-) Transcript_3648:2495-3118(-)